MFPQTYHLETTAILQRGWSIHSVALSARICTR